jgi:hypothetical protein
VQTLLSPKSQMNSRRAGAPSHRLVPDCVKTLGPKAREYVANYGLHCQPWQALVVDDMLGVRADKRWAARDAGLSVPRQNGKSVIAELLIIAGLYLFKEELIVYTAHQVDTALEIFERVVTRIEHNADLKRRLPRNGIRRAQGSQSITLDNPKQRLLIKARSKGGVRGFSADRIFFDEAQLGLNEEEIAALGPTQRTRPNPQTIFMGTPPLVTGSYWALKLRLPALAGDPKMSWHEWSPPKGFDPTDRDVWWATNPALGTLISEEDIEYDLKRLGTKFSAEALGFWLPEKDEAGWQVFREDDWQDAQDPTTEIVGPSSFAVELSRDLSTISIGAAGRNAEGKRHLELATRFPADVGRLIGWLRKRREKWQPVAVAMDPAGPASAFISDVEKHYGEIYKPIGRDVAAACGSVYVGISASEESARDVRIRPHPVLDAAARGAIWRDRGDARVFDRRNDDAPDVAPIMAVTLADLALASAPQQTFFGSWR